jgi:1-acyl-sn-glycerol-3-phosphate acyltransferase
MRRLKSSWLLPVFYWTCTYLLRALLTVVVRWKVTGREHVPRSGALIVVSNHLNNADPPILGAGVAKRRIRFMAKIELFRGPMGLLVKSWGAFPVRRFDADIRAMMNAEKLLKDGQVLGMFPEGTRSRTGIMGRPHPGTALIALRTGTTLLPCAITGTERLRNPLVLLRRPRFTVSIGQPIAVEAIRKPTEEQVSELTDRMFMAIASLLPPQYVDAYTENEAKQSTDGTDNPGE